MCKHRRTHRCITIFPIFSFILFAIVSDRSFLFFSPPGLNHKTWVEYIIIILSSASCQRIFGSSSLAARVFHRTMTGRRWMKFSFFFKTYYNTSQTNSLVIFHSSVSPHNADLLLLLLLSLLLRFSLSSV